MNNSIREYLEREMIVPQKYKQHIFVSGTLTLLWTLIGVRFGSYWFYIAMFMLLVFISGIISVSKFLSRELTLKRKLIIQTIIYINWFIQISLLETIIFTYEYGWQIGIALLYLPSVITPIILSLTTSIMLKKSAWHVKQSDQVKLQL